jgi:hypothetical protein
MTKLEEIDTTTQTGQYLMAAMGLLTSTIRKDKTPNQVLVELTTLKTKMYEQVKK